MKLIIDIPEEEYKRLVYIDMFKLRGYIQNGTPIPDNATNGDVIKAMFPSGKIWKSDSYMCLLIDGQGDAQMFDADWWNSPYQKGGKERDYDVECRNHSEMILNAQKGGKE